MRIGKLSNRELTENIFDVLKHKRQEILCRASLSEDCVSFETKDLVLISTDPITGDTPKIGTLAVTVSSNDIIAGGGEPFLVLLTIILPINETIDKVKTIMQDAEAEAEKLNIEIAGGHTEFSDAVNRPIVSAVALGFAKKHIKSTTPKIGDYIIVTKDVALEGTAIAIENYEAELMPYLTEEEIAEGKAYYSEVSIIKEGVLARNLEINAMHDITEGGVFGAVCEMCEANGVGAEIDVALVPLRDITNKVCDALNLDRYRLISSGSLIITTPNKDAILEAFKVANLKATVIGRVTSNKEIIADFGYQKTAISVTQDQLFLKYLNKKQP